MVRRVSGHLRLLPGGAARADGAGGTAPFASGAARGSTAALLHEAMRALAQRRPLFFATLGITRATYEGYHRAPTTMPLGVRLAVAAALEDAAEDDRIPRLRPLAAALGAATERVIGIALQGAALAAERCPAGAAPAASELVECLLWRQPPDRDLP